MVPHRAPHANDVLRNLLREEKKNQENKNAFRNVLLLLPQSHIYIFFFTRNLSLTQKAGTDEDLAAHTSGASLSLEQEIGLFYELDWAQEIVPRTHSSALVNCIFFQSHLTFLAKGINE